MHTYPSIPIFGCDCVLSLSLFLFLSNKLCLAPKHKSTLSRNPLQGSSSSSFDVVPPLHIQFCDRKAQQDFLKNFQKRGVHPEHHVVLSKFSDTPLLGVIRTRGWDSFMEEPMKCPIMFIQEFYSNIQVIDTSIPQFTTTFRDTRIVVTSGLIFEVLHVPKVSHLDYPGCECLRTVSRDELLSHFCEMPSI